MGKRVRRARPPRRENWVRPLLCGSLAFFLLALTMALLVRGRSVPLPAVQPPAEPLPDWIQEDLLPINEWSRPGQAMEAVNGVVVHYVGNPNTTAKQNRNYFAGLAKSHATSASSNFIVGLDGEVLLCVPMGEVAYCSGKRNADTLSIEVCHPDDAGEFTPESYASLIRLVNWLRARYDLEVDDVIRHYDVSGKECPRYYVRNPEAWDRFKADLLAAESAPAGPEEEP